jgi:AraC family transcriptional regulator
MNPVGKALWFIESHFERALMLDEIAQAACVSRFHLSRAFSEVIGISIQSYLRGRRLSEAARKLANGAPDILSLALDSGYNSHEAFTRAFRDQFGITPEAVRSQGHLNHLQLVEPIKMEESTIVNLKAPRIVNGPSLLIAGMGERYSAETSAKIPAQWQRFAPHLGHIPGQVNTRDKHVSYGVCCNMDEEGNIEYICGVEVRDFNLTPADWSRIRIPEQRYAVFTHEGHISLIRSTWQTIFNHALPQAELTITDGPSFERYDERFNPATGMGGLEIWIPIK